MIEVSTTDAVNDFHRLLAKVQHGQTVRIHKHGRTIARLVPDCDFMSGADFAKLFDGYKADALDKAAADDIEANLKAMKGRARGKILAH